MRARLHDQVTRVRAGERLVSEWSFYPDGRATTVSLHMHGITLDDGSAFRIFVKGAEAAPFRSDDGHARMDQARGTQTGFRMDSPMAGSDGWMVQGNAYRRTSSEALMTLPVFGSTGRIPLNLQFDGANLLGRYSWGLAGGEALDVSACAERAAGATSEPRPRPPTKPWRERNRRADRCS